MTRSRGAALAGLAGVAAAALAIEAAVRAGWLSALVVAAPSALPAAFATLWSEGFVAQPVAITLGQAFAATAAAAALGVPGGYWLWRSPALDLAYTPWNGAAMVGCMSEGW